MEKKCTKCEVIYSEPLTEHFNKKNGTADGFQYNCKKCIAAFHKEHYQSRKEYYLKKALRTNAEYRLRNLQYTVDYLKKNPCVDCGEIDPIVLEFDHREDKSHDVSSMMQHSLENLIIEISKCDVRCANCHKRKTAKQFDFYKGIVL